MEPEVEFQPGIFHLLDLHNEEAAKAMLGRAEEYLEEYSGYPSTSMKNAAGAVQCVLGEKEQALETFKQVLLDDPENLNALESSRIVHNQLGQKKDAEVCASKVQSLLDDGQSERGLSLSKTRCLAEQGLAITFNIAAELFEAMGGEDLDRIKKALTYSEKAFQLDNGMIFSLIERLQWQYFLGKSYLDVYNHYSRMGTRTEDQLDIYNKAVHALARVAREPNQENHQYKAKAWALLGTLFWKEPLVGFAAKPSSVAKCNLIREYNKPDLCFDTALELSPKDPKILCRYSRLLLKNEEYEKAEHILNESIQIDTSRKNWLAFSTRAKVYKSMYVKQQRAFLSARRSRQRGTPPDKSLLLRAKRDSEYSIKIQPNLQERINLGAIFNLLGQEEEAVVQFQRVVNQLEGRKNPEVHTKMGFCLRSMAKRANSDRRMAIESFKRAMEIERRNLPKLVSSFNALQLLMDESLNHPGCGYLLDEFCYWLAQVDEKYEDEPISELIQSLGTQYGRPMILACRRLINQGRFSLASKCLSVVRGGNTADEKQVQQLKQKISFCSNEMSLLNLSGASEHRSESLNIRPALSSSKTGKKTFDCLILHCMEKADSDWVHYSLLPRLEEAHGYKCCVPARDIHRHSSRDFESCVRDAACVIVVLTPSFCSDKTCHDQLADIVKNDSSKISVVVKGVCDLPETLRDMNTIQYYSWELLLRDIEEACKPRPSERRDMEACSPPSPDLE